MAGMIARRLLSALGVLLLASIVIFLVIAVSGDPLAELRDRQPPFPPPGFQPEEGRLGLAQPLLTPYSSGISGRSQGDLGPPRTPTRVMRRWEEHTSELQH